MNKLKEFILNMRWLYIIVLTCIAIGIIIRMGSAHAATLGVDAQKHLSKSTQCFSLDTTNDLLLSLGENIVGVSTMSAGEGKLPLIFYASENWETWTVLLIFPRHGMGGEDIACIQLYGSKVEWENA